MTAPLPQQQHDDDSALTAATVTIAAALPILIHRALGGAHYEDAFATLTGGISIAHDPEQRSVADVRYRWGLLELSAGNAWLDLVRAARLKLQPPAEPVLYGFLDRRPAGGDAVRVVHALLAEPAVVHDYLGLTRRRAQAYLADDRAAPSTINFQHHLRRCDRLYVSAVAIEWRGGAVSVRQLDDVPLPPKRRNGSPNLLGVPAACKRGRPPSLTGAESAALDALQSFIAAHGYPPTVRELGDALGARSPASVHRLLSQLDAKQAIRRDPGRARACLPLHRRPRRAC